MDFVWLIILVSSFIPGTTKVVDAEKGVYKKTISRWENALKKSDHGSTTFIRQFSSNGPIDKKHLKKSRDTIVYIPNALDTQRPIQVIWWFHGLKGFGSKLFSKRLMPQINYLLSRKVNFVLVIPEMPWSVNTSTKTKRQKRIWEKRANSPIGSNGNLPALNFEVKKILRGHFKKRTKLINVVVGHSAGGSAISSAAKSGSLNILKPRLVIFSDATYGKWGNVAWESWGATTEAHNSYFWVFVRAGDKPHKAIAKFIKNKKIVSNRFNVKVLSRRKYTHGRIGNEILKLAPIVLYSAAY